MSGCQRGNLRPYRSARVDQHPQATSAGGRPPPRPSAPPLFLPGSIRRPDPLGPVEIIAYTRSSPPQ